MLKKVLLCLILGTVIISSGCEKNATLEENSAETVQNDANSKTENSFPKTYNAESKSGKVKFSCTLEIPENLNGRTIQKTSVAGLRDYNKDKVYARFAEGKEISKKDQYDWDGGDVANYTFSDGSSLYLDNYVQWVSATSSLYSYLGVQQADYIDLFSSGSVSLDKDSCISEIEKDMNELGYDTENLSFQAIPLSVDAMEKLRDQELNNGLLEEGKTNEQNQNRRGHAGRALPHLRLCREPAEQEEDGVPCHPRHLRQAAGHGGEGKERRIGGTGGSADAGLGRHGGRRGRRQ